MCEPAGWSRDTSQQVPCSQPMTRAEERSTRSWPRHMIFLTGTSGPSVKFLGRAKVPGYISGLTSGADLGWAWWALLRAQNIVLSQMSGKLLGLFSSWHILDISHVIKNRKKGICSLIHACKKVLSFKLLQRSKVIFDNFCKYLFWLSYVWTILSWCCFLKQNASFQTSSLMEANNKKKISG